MNKGNIKYQNHLTVFFDILGFADLVNRTQDALDIYDIVNKLNFISSDLKKNMKRATFSDLVVLATTQTTSTRGFDAHVILNNIFNEIARIQAQLINNSILVRGGVTYDKLYVDKNFIFGKGLNYAYQLESKTANYPRIIIDPIVFDIYNSTYENHSQITMDNDGLYYVDYLKYITANHNEYLSVENFFKSHKEFIEQQVEQINNSGISSKNLKYTWLILKHNQCLSQLPDNYSTETRNRFNEYKIRHELITRLTKRSN